MIKIQKYQAGGLRWIINSVIEKNISISKYKPLSGSSYFKISKELKKGLIIIQNTGDSECLKLCLVRYLYPVEKNATRIRKVDKTFTR